MYERSDFSLSPIISLSPTKISSVFKYQIPLWEIEEITSFVHRHRRSISEQESILLDRLIDRYERNGSEEARKELKTFLIYLRRSVHTTPPSKITRPQIIDLDESRSKHVSVFSDETPRRLPPIRCPKNTKLQHRRRICTCSHCTHLRNTRRTKGCFNFTKHTTVSPITVPQLNPHSNSYKNKSSIVGTWKALKNTIFKQKYCNI